MRQLGKKNLNGKIADCKYCDVKHTFKVCSGRCSEDFKEEPKQETITYSEALKKEERIFNAKMTKEFWNTKQFKNK